MKSLHFNLSRLLFSAFLFVFSGLSVVKANHFTLQASVAAIAQQSNGLPGSSDLFGANAFSALPFALEPVKEFDFSIATNPTASGELTLNFKDLQIGIVRLSCYTYIGREVYTKLIPMSCAGAFTTVIDLPNTLSAGTYMLKVEANKSACTKMFILKKGA